MSGALIKHEKSINMCSWIDCNRGCFTLVKILESGNDHTRKNLKAILQDSMKKLERDNSLGAKILLKKLNEI